MTKGKPWTTEEEEQLKILLQQEKSYGVIAKVLGKSKNAVYQKCVDVGLKSKEKPFLPATFSLLSTISPAASP